MLQSFRNADFDRLAESWNSFYPTEFRIDAQQLSQNTTECPLFDWGASFINSNEIEAVRGFVAVKRSAAGLYPGVYEDVAHITAFAYVDPKVALDLLAEVKQVLRQRGIQNLVFGADSHHFFPGCPVNCRTLCDVLMVEGFEPSGEAFDMERDLSDYESQAAMPEGIQFRALGEKDEEELLKFFAAEFPGRWKYDVVEKIEKEQRHDCVYGAFSGDSLVGFALLQDSSHKFPIAGGVWRLDLGEKWGSLGPIGVAKEKRGAGIGHALLASALLEQKSRGVERCIIDWTVLEDFYERHGFKITRTYRPSTLRLSD